MGETTQHDFATWLAGRKPDPVERTGVAGAVYGNWRLKAFIGRGGSGEVWHAEHLSNGGRAAVKILYRKEEAYRGRFEREVSFLAEARDPGFPALYARGDDYGCLWAAVEELEPLVPPKGDRAVAAFLLALSRTLGSLHARGFVHRDIKPANIMMRGETPVLIDFGLVKDFTTQNGPAPAGPTGVTIVDGRPVSAGTPGYSAPEQFTGGNLSPASDIHALGVLADRFFGGEPPAAWVPIIRRCTSSIPEKRYPGVDAFARAVRTRHRARRLAVFGIAAAALLCAAAGWFALQGGETAEAVFDRIAPAPVLYVNAAADAAMADGSEKKPYAGLPEALAAAPDGAEIRVAPGTYIGPFTLTGRVVRLTASEGPSKTVLAGSAAGPVLSVRAGADGSSVKGFTVTGGRGEGVPSSYGTDWFGGGVMAAVSVRLEGCVIAGNGRGDCPLWRSGQLIRRPACATFGGGLSVSGGTATLVDCVVRDNFAWACGGGIAAIGANTFLKMKRCSVYGNRSLDFLGNQSGVGLSDRASMIAEDCVFAGVDGDAVGAFQHYGAETRCALTRCTVRGGPRAANIGYFHADEATDGVWPPPSDRGCPFDRPE